MFSVPLGVLNTTVFSYISGVPSLPIDMKGIVGRWVPSRTFEELSIQFNMLFAILPTWSFL